MKVLLSLLAVSVVALVGCLESEDSPALGDTEQAVTTPNVTNHICASGSCANLTISGSGASVCFITELDGDLAHGGSARIHKGFGSVWFLDILSPNNNNIKVGTACIDLRSGSTQTLVTFSSQSQNNPVFHGGAISRCFLSEVTVNNTGAFLAFDTSFSIVNQQPGANDYGIIGTFPSGSNVTIGMECFSASTLLAGLAYGNGTPNPVNGTLVTGDTAQNVVCGLTGVGGQFSTPNTTNGIRTYRSGTTWGWEASGWKGVSGLCVR
ncbi:MAG: hypothetical protein ABIY55_35975 [Kofleriaceae bacterium]